MARKFEGYFLWSCEVIRNYSILIRQKESDIQVHDTPSREDQHCSSKFHPPVSVTSSDALESSIASKNLDTR